MVKTDVLIIGGGASGYFAANQILEQSNSTSVVILEKTNKILSKVKISGGGRCNVTNGEKNPRILSKAYPRGEKFLSNNFKAFGSEEAYEWFNSKGAELKTENDGRVFPHSDNSQTIINILTEIHNNSNFQLKNSVKVESIERFEHGWKTKTNNGDFESKTLILALGSVNKGSEKLLQSLNIETTPPVPSLFTFNLLFDESTLKNLQGVAHNCVVRIAGEKLESEGPMLFTHWGISGPATLKLSAFGARILADKEYRFKTLINFSNVKQGEAEETLKETKVASPKKLVKNTPQFEIPNKLWLFILERANIESQDSWNDISGKKWNKLVNELTQAEFDVDGKSTFKDEFVTAGGVKLSEVNKKTCEHKSLENLYFTGELLDIDAITGGYNFQSCWTTGYLVATSITQKLNR